MKNACMALKMCAGCLVCAQIILAMLQNGNVLTAGGADDTAKVDLASAEVFDVKSRLWTPVGNMSTPRSQHQVWGDVCCPNCLSLPTAPCMQPFEMASLIVSE